MLTDVANVRALVHGEPVGHLHHRCWGAALGRVDGSRDVIHGGRLLGDLPSHRIVHLDRAGSANFASMALFASILAQIASEAIATAIISRPSSLVPIE